eukprot:8145673-Pyramimonas_sp.AAC.1
MTRVYTFLPASIVGAACVQSLRHFLTSLLPEFASHRREWAVLAQSAACAPTSARFETDARAE